jgi:hypothetical protein
MGTDLTAVHELNLSTFKRSSAPILSSARLAIEHGLKKILALCLADIFHKQPYYYLYLLADLVLLLSAEPPKAYHVR